MKRTLLIIPFIIIYIFCYGNNVKVKVDFNFKPKNDSITIAVVYHNGSFFSEITTLDTLLKIKPGKFELQLQPGTYICRFLHPEITYTDIPLVIESQESKLEFDLYLEKSSLPSEIKTVQLIIKTNNKKPKVLSLNKSGKIWTIPQNSILPKNIKSYVFRVNNYQYYHRLSYPTQLQRILLYYENIFQGEDIYFSEEEYFQGKNNITFHSNEIDIEYCYSLYKEISEVFESSYIGRLDLDSSSNARYFLETSSIFDRMIEEEDPYFSQIVIEPYLRLIDRHHPASFKLQNLSRNMNRDEVNKLKQTESYKDMEEKKLDLLKLIDVKSPFLSGSFLSAFRNHCFDFRTPYKYIEYDLPFGFFLKLEYDFQLQTPSYYAKGNMLARDITHLRRENPNKALQLIDILEKEYPRHPSARYNRLEKLKTELLLKQGLEAPEFELVDLKGETIKLSDFRGKYIFLDFWGTWCAPCMSELPNIKELSENIPRDKLIVIGVACNDKEERVEKIIQEKNLQYLIAMANNEIIDDYGISSYPTTYLIDPKGIIIGKNLRGGNLSGRINSILY